MGLLKNLSIGYTASLKDIRLVNFSVSRHELGNLAAGLPLFEIDGRVVISMLDVRLCRFRPSFLFKTFHFAYRHIAFRVLVKDDWMHEDMTNRGMMYLHSFTNNSFIVECGKLFTDFNFKYARISQRHNDFSLSYKQNHLHYSLDFETAVDEKTDLRKALMNIDRVYAKGDNGVKVTRVKRSDLPLQPVRCCHFETNFFNETNLLGAFYVNDILEYEWLPPQNCLLAS